MTTIQKIGIVNFAVTTMMMIASPPPFGGGNFLKEETAEEAARLFKYSDDDYNHLDDDYLNEDERWIDTTDSKKRVKVGHCQGNLIAVGKRW